uniref:Uncharacterized protein n=1 Tax=Oryza glumipatula TaxID=40148 RepID=A0A0E0AQG6_9ORYZ
MPSGGRRLPPWTSPRGAAPRAPLSSVDSPYVRAKQAQVIEKDPNKAVPLFWAAINSGDRIESALKDMATVLKQANRAEEAIEAIRSFRDRCPNEAQESLDNILLDLYKKCGRTKEQIEMLTLKLRIVDEELASGRWKTKLSKSHGRVVYLSLRDEKARLLGNLAWAHMQSENYDEAEMLYRQALAIEADYNKECNLAICLIKTGKVAEAKYLLQSIPDNCSDESHVRSLARAREMLMELESPTLHSPITQMKSKESLIWLAIDAENLGHLQPQVSSTALTQLKSEEPHISVAADAEKQEDCNSQVFPSPITQMKREEPESLIATSGEKNEKCLNEYQDLSRLFNDAATPQSLLEKLRKRLVKEGTLNISIQHQVQIPSFVECLPNSGGSTDAGENTRPEGKALVNGVRKTWADMVEEDERQLGDVSSTIGMDTTKRNVSCKHANEEMYRTLSFSQESSALKRSSVDDHPQSSSADSWRHSDSKISTDENVNMKFVRTAPQWRQQKVQDYSNRVSQRLDTSHLSDRAEGTEQPPWRSSTAQRSLFPDWKSKCERYGHGYVPFGDNEHFQGSSHFEATNRWPKNARPWRPQNRLRVFQEITNEINQKTRALWLTIYTTLLFGTTALDDTAWFLVECFHLLAGHLLLHDGLQDLSVAPPSGQFAEMAMQMHPATGLSTHWSQVDSPPLKLREGANMVVLLQDQLLPMAFSIANVCEDSIMAYMSASASSVLFYTSCLDMQQLPYTGHVITINKSEP